MIVGRLLIKDDISTDIGRKIDFVYNELFRVRRRSSFMLRLKFKVEFSDKKDKEDNFSRGRLFSIKVNGISFIFEKKFFCFYSFSRFLS